MTPLRVGLIGMTFFFAYASVANAWHFECRFIERVGSTNMELPGNAIDASSGAVRSIRIQFGVFDDADSLAPLGGYVGWNLGTITVSGASGNSDVRRNNGRIAPFTFGGGPFANGNLPFPSGDPFTLLTEIDNTLGTQSPLWICNADGTVPPIPPATVRGRNTFVSVYAFSIDPRPGATSYEIALGGNLIAATEWRFVGTPNPPRCPPGEEWFDGNVTYAPFPTPPQSFGGTLSVFVPAPVGGVVLALGSLCLAFRTRRIRERCGTESAR